jgi:hypothetical protein
MNAPHDLDRRLDDWLQDGPNRAPDRSIAAALDHARAHPRRRDPLAFLRRDPMGSRGFASGSGLRAMPLVAALGLLLVAALAVATVGGLFQGQPVVVPPVATPSPSAPVAPSATAQPSPSAPSPSPLVTRVDLIGFDGRVLSTIEIVDGSGTLVDPRTGQPGENASAEAPHARNDPADPATVVLTWNGLLSDEDRRLTIASDGRTMTLDVLPGCGDLLPVVRELILTFDGPVPADDVTITVVSAPRTCE